MTPEARNELRREALRWLASRPACAHSLKMVTNGLKREGLDAPEAEVVAALAFLCGDKLVETVVDPLGSTKTYKVTSDGTRYDERNP